MEGKSPLHRLTGSSLGKVIAGIILVAALAGVGTGYAMSKSNAPTAPGETVEQKQAAKSAESDHKTFRDFAEGTVTKKEEKKADYSEGTHILQRVGATPVTLTSSVVDLAQYEGKKVRVYGESQRSKAAWLMDVGRVDEIK